MQLIIEAFAATEKFASDLKSLPSDIRADLQPALDLLKANPRANSLRCHSLKGQGKPTIYKIDLRTDRSYQVSFVLEGRTAKLLRIGTHKEVDRSPRD